MINILIIEDEEKISKVIKAYFDKEGYNCTLAYNGNDALKYFGESNFDIVILDRMLPDLSGEEICKIIRSRSSTHIIMLTAKTEDDDKIQGFNLGCDDYICKPFNVKELVLRVKAVGRKINKSNEEILIFGDKLEINKLSHSVKVRGEEVVLTNTEYKIILTLANNPKKIFTREELLELVLAEYYEKLDRVIDAHIKNLRQKIEIDKKNPIFIKTVYGVGYKFGI